MKLTFRRVISPLTMLGLMLGLLSGGPAMAQSPNVIPPIKSVQESDVILTGKIVEVGQEVRVEVQEVLKGSPIPAQIEVPQVFDHSGIRSFDKGLEVLLILQKGNFSKSGWGIRLGSTNKAETVEGMKQILAIRQSDEKAIDQAMFRWAISDNRFLRNYTHIYLFELSASNRSSQYHSQFLGMLSHPDADVRSVGLQYMQWHCLPKALPLIIKASRDSDIEVVCNASMALAEYNTPESVAALVTLTQHPDPNVRVRASIDLQFSQRNEAKTALVALLDDPSSIVRAYASSGLKGWLERGESTEVLPRLFELLEDPDPETQQEIAFVLLRVRQESALEPLLKRLERKEMSERLESTVMDAIATTYKRAGAPSRGAVDAKLDLIVAELERGPLGASMSAINVLALNKSPQAITALQRAVQTHPRQEIREYAARMLPK